MTSIVFSAPRHLEPNLVMTWALGELFVHNLPLRLERNDYVYVCNRNRILFRARYREPIWGHKVTGEGEDRGYGWKLKVGAAELPPREITRRCHTGFSYLDQGELW